MHTLPGHDINDFLNDLIDQVETSVRMHNGQLLDFSGESVLVFFQDNHDIASALDVAIDCKQRLHALLTERGIQVRITFRTGIARGTFHKYYHKEGGQSLDEANNNSFKIMGEALNLSGRLLSFSEEDQVLVNQEVYEKSITTSWNPSMYRAARHCWKYMN
jgi:class 3 adenylate cyclase